jgi:hypothetical protein
MVVADCDSGKNLSVLIPGVEASTALDANVGLTLAGCGASNCDASNPVASQHELN